LNEAQDSDAATRLKSKVSSRQGQFTVRFLCKAEIVGALDGHFVGDFEDLANDVEIVFLRFFGDYAVGCKGSVMLS
jgi:hypothetical protein